MLHVTRCTKISIVGTLSDFGGEALVVAGTPACEAKPKAKTGLRGEAEGEDWRSRDFPRTTVLGGTNQGGFH